MAHLVLSRKYRPGRFGDLVGQEHVAQTLSNAITSGRIGHAYLFIGPRGTGKTTTARIFAKALNCAKGPTPEPCGTCASCEGITRGNDLDVVEMDAASNNGVDDVRALRDSVGYRPSHSRFRIWIVDEVHMLSLPAFNAFLKTLEEPPPEAKFLFCTTEAHKLPETFTSRVQRLEFRRIDETRISSRLASLAEKEGLAVEDGVCDRIASGALGGLRDAESLLEQLLSCAENGRVTLLDLDGVAGRASSRDVASLLSVVRSGDAGLALDAAAACLAGGAKPDVVLDQCVEAFRALLATAARRKPSLTGAEDGDLAAAFGLPRIARSLDLLLEKRRHLKDGADGRLVVEIAAVELARLPSARDLDALVAALSRGATPTDAGPGVSSAAASSASGTVGRAGPVVAPGRGYVPPVRATPVGGAVGTVPAGGGLAEIARDTPPVSAAEASPGCAVPKVGPGSAASIDLATLVAAWPQVVAGVERRSRRVGSAFSRARVVGVLADVMSLALATTDAVSKAVLRERETAEMSRAVTREVLGVSLRPVVDDETRPSAIGAGASPSPSRPVTTPAGPAASPAPARDDAGSAPPTQTGSGASQDAGARSGAAARTGNSMSGSGLDEIRAHPTVKAVLDAFGARVLAVQAVEEAGAVDAPRGPA